MSQENWNKVEDYHSRMLRLSDSALDGALEAVREAGMPEISVSPPDGKLLYLLARMVGARQILEIGTLGGYSTIWLARALPADGRLVTLEYEPKHAQVAAHSIEAAGLSSKVQIAIGPALDSLATLEAEGAGPFDLTFIDADKENNAEYVQRALKLSRPGSLIIVDNVVRGGAVADEAVDDPRVHGTRRMFEMLADEPRLSATAIQTVSSKGWDGMAIMLVEQPQ